MIKDEGEQNFSNKETSKMKSNEISTIDVESNKKSRSIDEQNLKVVVPQKKVLVRNRTCKVRKIELKEAGKGRL